MNRHLIYPPAANKPGKCTMQGLLEFAKQMRQRRVRADDDDE